MKKITFLLIILCASYSIAQEKITLTIDNPSPRVGQEIKLSINSDFFTDYLQKQMDSDIELTNSTSVFGKSSNSFERIIIFKEAKKYTIGPFNFEFNGTKYTTTTIDVDVLPELKLEAGVWIRIKEHEGETLLILEQLIRNESNKKSTDNKVSYTIGGVKPAGTVFAELKNEIALGITIRKYMSSSSTKRVNEEDFSSPGFSYSIQKYKVEFDRDFKGSYTITEKDFENLPKDFPIDYIELKK
ncbi:BatD family protein [uncultured Kordia sp.]|uniref:BatD family protein n=1 Tax=uncultured Kordia sp. TaxID=507699 RepID=UPI002635EEC5|nr:BatD family protein [uncultured Kordia sp.]